MGSCAQELKIWRERITNFKEKLGRCRGRMERFRGCNDSQQEKEYSIMLSQQEDLWKQRVNQHWLQAGDSNSKFFHAYASARRKKNQISQLKYEIGQWRTWSNGLGDLIESFYRQLFQSNNMDMNEVLDCIEERIIADQNLC